MINTKIHFGFYILSNLKKVGLLTEVVEGKTFSDQLNTLKNK